VVKLDNTLNLRSDLLRAGLIAPAPVAEPSAGARSQFTIWVEDAAPSAPTCERGVTLRNGLMARLHGDAALANQTLHKTFERPLLSPKEMAAEGRPGDNFIDPLYHDALLRGARQRGTP
jgi:hypothetical protein